MQVFYRGQIVEFIVKDKWDYNNFCHFCKLFRVNLKYFTEKKIGGPDKFD